MVKATLKENQGLPQNLLWILAIIAGLAVANIYYNQPLLGMIKADLNLSDFTTNLVAMITQAGYAMGLLLIVPLGDLYRRRPILLVTFSVLVISLLGIYIAPNIYILLFASFFTGACSMIPQIFVPIASQISTPETKEKNVGMIIAGLLTGILISRVISGVVGQYWGWRTMYLMAAIIMLLSTFVIYFRLPEINPTFKGSYKKLMGSIIQLIREEPALLRISIKTGFAFAAFLAFWSVLAFKLAQPPLNVGSDVVGLLGLFGVVSVLGSTSVGGYIKRVGVIKMSYIGIVMNFIAWLMFYFLDSALIWFGLGIMVRDAGLLFLQLSNQTYVLSIKPEAANRINTIFMTTYFAFGAIGSLLAGAAWQMCGWGGVTILALILISCTFILNTYDYLLVKKSKR